MTSLKEFLDAFADRRLTNDELATLLGVSESTVKRRLVDGFPADDAIRAARALGAPVVATLVGCGYLTEDEGRAFGEREGASLDEFSDMDLAREILRRVEAGSAGPALTGPVGGVDEDPEDYTLAALDVPDHRDIDAEVEGRQHEA